MSPSPPLSALRVSPASWRSPHWVSRSLLLLSLAAVTLPLLGVLIGVVRGLRSGHTSPVVGTDASNVLASLPTAQLVASTLLWCSGIAAGALILSLPAAWVVRAKPHLLPLLLVPLALPNYYVYAAANLLRSPGTWLGDWAAHMGEQGHTFVPVLLGRALAAGSLMFWLWPVALVAMIPGMSTLSQSIIDASKVDGARVTSLRSIGMFARALLPNLMLALGLCTLLLMGSPVPLHVSQVPTLTMHVWATLVQSPDQTRIWLSTLPLIMCATAGAWILTRALTRAKPGTHQSDLPEKGGLTSTVLTVVLFAVSALLPLALCIYYLRSPAALLTFLDHNIHELNVSISTAFFVGVLGFGLGLLSWFAHASHTLTHPPRWVAPVLLIWCALVLTPGVLLSGAVANILSIHPALSFLYESTGGVILAHTLRFGALAVLTGWLLAAREGEDQRAARLLETGGSARGFFTLCVQAHWPTLAGAAIGMALLSLHDIETSILLQPPGLPTLPQLLLGYLHFFKTEELSAAMVILVGTSLLIATTVSMVASRSWTKR